MPQPPEIPSNPDITMAEANLERARLQLAEWTVLDTRSAGRRVPLSDLLELARQEQKNGNYPEASRLAKKVSRFALLGLQQALQQANARPYYPQ